MNEEPKRERITPLGLRWRYAFDKPGPDFVLVRDREGDEPEEIGRMYKDIRSRFAEIPKGWSWSMNCWRPFEGAPRGVKSDFVATKREAIEGILAAWALEEAWRAEMRAKIETTHGCWSWGFRYHVVHGVPTPPKWVRGGG